MSRALAARTGVKIAAAAKAPAFFNIFLLEFTISSSFVAAAARAVLPFAAGLEIDAVVVNASVEEIARNRTKQICRKVMLDDNCIEYISSNSGCVLFFDVFSVNAVDSVRNVTVDKKMEF